MSCSVSIDVSARNSVIYWNTLTTVNGCRITSLTDFINRSLSYLQIRPAAKFESVDDILIKTFTRLFVLSELDIIKHVDGKNKQNQYNVTEFQTLPQQNRKNTVDDKKINKNFDDVKQRLSKQLITLCSEDKKEKTDIFPTKLHSKSEQSVRNEGEITKKFKTFVDLPVEIHDQLISLWNVNDFGTLADVAEFDGCFNVALYARGCLTSR